jgi:hypothetical protein
MEDQRAPNLEEMDEEQARQFLSGLYSRLSPEEEFEVRHHDYVMEMPQSGERFRGRENMRAFQRAHPALVSAGAPSAGQGGTVGRRGSHRLRRRAGIRRGGDQRA